MAEIAAHDRCRVLAGRQPAEVAASRLDELDVRHVVVPGDLQGSHQLADADRGHGPAQVGRVVAQDHALGSLDYPDPEDHAAADRVIGLVAGQRAQLKEGRVGIEEQRDALPDRHLAAAAVTFDRTAAPAERRLPQQAVDAGQQVQHLVAVRQEGIVADVDGGGQDRRGHRWDLPLVKPGQASGGDQLALRTRGWRPAQSVKPSRRARIWSITSSAPPPMDTRRLSRKYRDTQVSSM